MSLSLSAEGMSKSFARNRAITLRGIDLRVGPGEVVTVAGPPGSGKTTLLRCLTGTYRPDGGRVLLRADDGGRGGDSLELSSADARTVAWVRQHHLALLDGPLPAPPRATVVGAVGRWGRCGPAAAAAGLERLGLETLAHLPIGRLRPAEARRVALVAALLAPAAVLLLDEPTAEGHEDAVCEWLEERRAAGAGIVAAAGPSAAVHAAATASGDLREGVVTWQAR